MKKKIHYYDISWNSLLDGPGTRVVLFLQGCHLKCPWCHSPQSQGQDPELLFFESRCIRCGNCVAECPNDVHKIKDGTHYLDRDLCQRCGLCVQTCPLSISKFSMAGPLVLPPIISETTKLYQRLWPQLDLLKQIGGLTISGGEPLLQYEPLKGLLQLCRKDGIHTAVETSGSVSKQGIEELHEIVDCWLFGIRPVSEELCPPNSIADLKLVKENLEFLSSYDKNKIIIRTPLIPGFTDSSRQLSEIANTMRSNDLSIIELLPYNPNSGHFYKALGKDFQLSGTKPMPESELIKTSDYFTGQGFKAKIVGD